MSSLEDFAIKNRSLSLKGVKRILRGFFKGATRIAPCKSLKKQKAKKPEEPAADENAVEIYDMNDNSDNYKSMT
jgi:hypothetical protein